MIIGDFISAVIGGILELLVAFVLGLIGDAIGIPAE